MVVKTTDNLQLLGVTLDSDLSFSDHINLSCKIASQRIGVLMRLRNLIPTLIVKINIVQMRHLTLCYLLSLSNGTFGKLAILENWREYKKEASEQFLRSTAQAIINCSRGPVCPHYLIDDFKTSLFWCMKLNISYAPIISVIFSAITPERIT